MNIASIEFTIWRQTEKFLSKGKSVSQGIKVGGCWLFLRNGQIAGGGKGLYSGRAEGEDLDSYCSFLKVILRNVIYSECNDGH